MTDLTTTAELIDRVAEKVARMRGVAGTTSSDDRLVVRLATGRTVTFTIEEGTRARR